MLYKIINYKYSSDEEANSHGVNMVAIRSNYLSPLGNLVLIANEEALFSLGFEERIEEEQENSTLIKVKAWLDKYFNHERPNPYDLPLSLKGTPFQIEVWNILLTIPYGETLTYGDIAKIIATRRNLNRMSAQAVGGAVGANPLPLIIPCHRVIGANNTLGGYSGGEGIKTKISLLKHEGVDVSRFKYLKGEEQI